MNQLEKRYGEYLQTLKNQGQIKSFKFEALKLRLADRTWYTPDYLVLDDDYAIEFHEVKGFWEDDARVKVKAIAEQFPHFRFLAAKRNKKKDWPINGEWAIEEFSGYE